MEGAGDGADGTAPAERSVGEIIAELMEYRDAGSLLLEDSKSRALEARSLNGAAATLVQRQARSPEPISSLTSDNRVQGLLARMRALEATPSAKIGDADEVIADLDREYNVLRQEVDFPLKDLRAREKLRKKSFVNNGGDVYAARHLSDVSGAQYSAVNVTSTAARRAQTFRESALRDPGPLSKFGEGDGSFFDNWLANHRFQHTTSGAKVPSGATAVPTAQFDYMATDPFARPSVRLPRVGLKQWQMPKAELAQAAAFAEKPLTPAPVMYGAVATGYESRRKRVGTSAGSNESSGGDNNR